MSISDNIKRIREEHKLTQEEFGKIAGVTDKAVSTWELGIKAPRMGTVQKISEYFNIPKSAILDDIAKEDINLETAPRTSTATYLAPLEQELINDFRKLTDYGKKAAVERVKELTELSAYTIEKNDTVDAVDRIDTDNTADSKEKKA